MSPREIAKVSPRETTKVSLRGPRHRWSRSRWQSHSTSGVPLTVLPRSAGPTHRPADRREGENASLTLAVSPGDGRLSYGRGRRVRGDRRGPRLRQLRLLRGRTSPVQAAGRALTDRAGGARSATGPLYHPLMRHHAYGPRSRRVVRPAPTPSRTMRAHAEPYAQRDVPGRASAAWSGRGRRRGRLPTWRLLPSGARAGQSMTWDSGWPTKENWATRFSLMSSACHVCIAESALRQYTKLNRSAE